MYSPKFSLLILLFSALHMFAQQPRCYTQDNYENTIKNNPALSEKIKNIQQQIQKDTEGDSRGDGDIYVIPVVVHIVYKTGSQNISDERIFSQINVLNDDFRRLNDDADETPSEFQDVAADVMIEFCLTSLDPNGDSTTGITRTETEKDSFPIGSQVKKTSSGGIDSWDTERYLNIWVCNLPSDVLGFSSVPGFPESEDGVVIGYKFFGSGMGAISPYNLGRTCTHEIGHYLGLQHIWGDDSGSCSGSDLIADTPNQAWETFGCATFPLVDDCTETSPGVMFMNYMDYTDDNCMNMFTEGQKTKMRTTIEEVRETLLISSALGCNVTPPSPGEIAEIIINPNPADNQFAITVKN
ncbi:MAG: zinc metalloprotease, partial [Fimbriimonadaceae bacterium]|nr:zinc metalloprotease [Chitinophagales bacterium]